MMKANILLVVLLWISNYGQAVERNTIRRNLLLHRASRSLGRIDPFYSEEAARIRYKRQVGSSFPSDDEEISDKEGSGGDSSDVDVSVTTTLKPVIPAHSTQSPTDWAWYRTTINFLDSISYIPALSNHSSEAFLDLSDELMVEVEDYLNTHLAGYHEAVPIMYNLKGDDVIVLIDVGTCMSQSLSDVTNAIMSLVLTGRIGRFRVTDQGFGIKLIGIDTNRIECTPGPSLPTTTIAPPTTSTPSTYSTTTEPSSPSFDISTNTVSSTARPTVVSTTEQRPCRRDQATCKNLQCIDKSYVCDGTLDCLDGSDEPESCSAASLQCDPTEFLCVGTGLCVQKTWRCDGDNDCGDGYDEQNCPTASPDARCAAIQFECRNRVCIPSSYQCDKEEDCDDGSDEEGCTPPVVITPPRQRVNAFEGETVTLECEAVGVPTPIISWRVNWANVPPPPRVTMTSQDGKGVLTIRKIKKSDQGAYTCEAINPNGAILGIPDSVVTVEDNPTEPPPPPTTTSPAEVAKTTEVVASPCLPGEYNSAPGDIDICKPCYCFGVTNQCSSSRMEYSEVEIVFDEPDNKEGVMLKPTDLVEGNPQTTEPITENQIDVNPPARELQLIDLSKRFLAAAHYWSLPAQFLGAKINSYGGTLTFSFSYNNSFHASSVPTNHTDVILEGGGKTLLYDNPGSHPAPKVKHTEEVKLDESGWKTPDGKPATRADMMDVLSDLDKVLLRTVYDNSMLSTGIGDVKLQVARPVHIGSTASRNQSAGVIATAVEECECPEGYEGLSCQECSEGYSRVISGPDIGKCLSEEINDSPAGVVCPVGYKGEDCKECAPGYDPYEDGCTRYPDTYCNVAGSIGIDVDLGCQCKLGCEGPRCDKCKPGYYFLSEDNEDGCLPCFCMGVTNKCNSTTWNSTEITPTYNNADDFVITNSLMTRSYQNVISIEPSSNARSQSVVSADLDRLPIAVYYWMLPEEFTGNKLASYGGKLDYTISYTEGDSAKPISRLANVRLIGKGMTVDYVSDRRPLPGRENRYVVDLHENFWQTQSGSPVSRDEMLILLSNVEHFLVRATYSDKVRSSRITNIYLDSAVPKRTGLPRAYQVEQCVCPPGYTGLSCESCADGWYFQQESGSLLGTCQPCNCHGHSNDCDKTTGICRNCRHDTFGDHCERCDDGFYGDARSGKVNDCQRCPCPTVKGRTDEEVTATCHANVDGEPVCDECPSGYQGDRCERCAPGYTGNPLVPGFPCRRSDGSCQCDPVGSIDGTCDASGQCNCKPSTTGRKCDQCKAGFFHLSVQNSEGGCLPCFCMGLTKQCTSATYKRNEVTSDFASDYGGFTLIQRGSKIEISEGFELLNQGRTLSYPRLDTLSRGGPYYWQLPEEYRGNKVVSYGGKLQYKASYTIFSGTLATTNDPDVILIGNDITIMATIPDRTSRVTPLGVMDRSVIFRENHWRRADGQPATREHLLMALADVEALLIRATYSRFQLRSTISDVAMETASESVLMTEPAYEVEQCECPDGYDGLSCEDCARGFTRSGSGIYLGLCHQCQCNGHSDLCDSETGVCEDCRDNTSGDRCQECARGYYGVATHGTESDCQPCACPGTGSDSFSETCRFDELLGSVECTACQEGYVGRRCETCAPGYEGNPTSPGGRCTKRDPGLLPQVSVSPKRVNAKEHSTVTLECSVTSPSGSTRQNRVTVSWRRVGSNSGALPSDAMIGRNGRALRLPKFTRSQAGTYECVATNRFGSNSDSAVLTVARENPMIEVKVEEPRHVRIRVGSQVSFVCTASSKMSAYIVSWTKRGAMLPLSRITDFNGILHISNVQLSDSGTYVCTGSNMYSTDQETATLIVEGNEVIRPTVTVTPHNQSVSEGEDAMFYCTARGFPKPDIEWRRADGKPMPSNIHIVGSMLMIPSASTEDRALYYCRASNSHGVVEATGALDVTEQGLPPTVEVNTPEVTLTVGDDGELSCSATGDPKPVFSWQKNGQELPKHVETIAGTLRLTSVTFDDQGTYSCTAKNVFGEDSGLLQVTVKPKAIFNKPVCRTEPKEVTAYVGTNSTITCVVGGDPLPEVTWKTDDGSVLDQNIKLLGKKMWIIDVQRSNAGKYVCVATNRNGASRSKMTLHVVKKDLPKVVITPHRRQNVKAGNDLSFTCLAPGQSDADITWMRSDKKPFTGGTYLSNNNTKLNFHNISTNEAGSYMCIASNVVGHREVGVYVYVTQPPIISVLPARYIDLTEGESVNLQCRVSGVPPPSVVWLNATGGGSPSMLTNYRLRSNFYSIKRARLSDAGDYFCRATNRAGNSKEKVVITVHPKIILKPPVVMVEAPTASGTVGSQIELHCIASGTPAPSITWLKENEDLPSASTQSEGILRIPNLSASDAGRYICVGLNQAGRSEKMVDLEILVPPLVAIQPSSNIAIMKEEAYVITCAAMRGSSPMTLTWTKDSGQISSSILTSGGRMQVVNFDPERDSGSYTCTGSNDAGISTSSLVLREATPPVIEVTPHNVTKEVGQSAEFVCGFAPGSDSFGVTIQWRRSDRITMDSPRISTSGSVLSISNILLDDATEYECVATNQAGTTTASADLTVQAPPNVSLYLIEDKSVYTEGASLTIICNATGFPIPALNLFKNGNKLEISKQGQYIIDSLLPSDGGTYTCMAGNDIGNSEIERSVIVHGVPTVSVDPSSIMTHSGDDVIIDCKGKGLPKPTVTWSKKNGDLPEGASVANGQLQLERARVDDAGDYVCTASNEVGNSSAGVHLDVNAFIPYFTQTPLSYMVVDIDEKKLYLSFNMTVSFRANLLDGLILYSVSSNNDFISLSLAGGIVEFRFNVGSGPAEIRSQMPIETGKWHTVFISRKENRGQLQLDGGEVVKGKSAGEFRALELSSKLYVGGVPPGVLRRAYLRNVGSDPGFYGCISQLSIGEGFLDMGSSEKVTEKVGVVRCRTCGSDAENSPCQHKSVCLESHNDKLGHVCQCKHGYIGRKCQFVEEEICAIDACGPEATCRMDLNTQMGYVCDCNEGYKGIRCLEPIITTTIAPTIVTETNLMSSLFARGGGEIVRPAGIFSARRLDLLDHSATPHGDIVPSALSTSSTNHPTEETVVSSVRGALSFSQDSYLKSTSVRFSDPMKTDIRLRIRRQSRADGLILYGGRPSQRSPFISISIRNNALEFRFSTGAGTTLLRAPVSALGVGTWHNIRAMRKRRRGKMYVDGKRVSKAKASGPEELHLDDVLYIGGTKYWEDIPARVNIRDGFDGCIEALQIDDVTIPFDSRFTRKKTEECRRRRDSSSTSQGAGNSRVSVNKPRYMAKFSGTSYASFDKNMFPHDGAAEQISVRFRTTEPYGLMLFHGEDLDAELGRSSRIRPRSRKASKRRGVVKDFVSLGVRGSFLVYTFELGGGQSRATSNFPVSDGVWHTVTILRRGSLALMWLDDMPLPVATQSLSATHTTANTPGRVYIGGAPDVIFATAGRYTSGFNGCMENVRLTSISSALSNDLGSGYLNDSNSTALDFSRTGTLERYNLRRCVAATTNVN